MATRVTLMYAFVYCDVYSYKKQFVQLTLLLSRPASPFSMKGNPQRVMIQYDVTVATGVNLRDPCCKPESISPYKERWEELMGVSLYGARPSGNFYAAYCIQKL